MRPWSVAAAALVAVAVAGCGEISNTYTPNPGTANVVKVMLAGPPNAFYVGLYEAQALGYFKQTDIDLEIEVPAAGQDPVQLLHEGKLTLAFASMPTVLLHRNQDEPVVGIAAITDVPLNAIKASYGSSGAGPCAGAGSGGAGLTTTTATDTVTCSTAPSATTTPTTATGSSTAGTTTTGTGSATSAATAPGRRGSPASTPAKTITGSEPDTGLWPAQLKSLIKGPSVPGYDGLVVVARKGSIVDDAPLLRRFVQALARGYRAARANPVNAVQRMDMAVPSLGSSAVQQLATVQAALPHFFPDTGRIWGWQSPTLWNTFGTWMQTHHLISNPNALVDASTNELLQGEGV